MTIRRTTMRRRTEARMRWGRESDLVADLIAAARRDGFRCYPETSGFDVLLVAADGAQVGVQAKLRANVDVVAQAIPHRRATRGPDSVAALVPTSSRPFDAVCGALGVVVIDGSRHLDSEVSHRADTGHSALSRLLASAPRRVFRAGRVWVPPFEPDIPGGVPGPVTMTPWKVKAVRLCAKLRERGFVTTADFRELDMSPTWWTRARTGVLVRAERVDNVVRYRQRDGARLPDDDYSWVRAGLAAMKEAK